MFSKFWDEYVSLLDRSRVVPISDLTEIVTTAQDLAADISNACKKSDADFAIQLNALTSTVYKFAAGCARRSDDLMDAVNFLRLALEIVEDCETREELIDCLCELGRISEACIELNSVSMQILSGNNAECGARLLQLICNQTALCCGVTDEVLRLCVMASNLREGVTVTHSKELKRK